MRNRWVALGVFAAALAAPAVCRIAIAGDIPYWPSEQEERLREVEHDVLDVQSKLATARLTHDDSEAKKLSEQFKKLEDERVQLLRATGKLPQVNR
jgi:cob(I)alamin adenosyltransferase